jgi:2'-5' RNA ligase
MVKYNLALTPSSKNLEAIECANQFTKLADSYLLGENSLPHVTLYQSEAKDEEICQIWNRIVTVWKEEMVHLEFRKLSCLSFDDSIFWVSLLPNNCDKLHEMHRLIAQILGETIKQNFDPHMTLFNTKNKDYQKVVESIKCIYKPLADDFILSLGTCDSVGQLTKILFKY